ncbi:protein SMG9-like [Anneissia japonica]|uniref:protein SMG9-like n=1 Tax=Anneissia japonica TaxID=1529436 RepID=UPI001425A480|nr:protein SMG9-like [Anneissia japonica]
MASRGVVSGNVAGGGRRRRRRDRGKAQEGTRDVEVSEGGVHSGGSSQTGMGIGFGTKQKPIQFLTKPGNGKMKENLESSTLPDPKPTPTIIIKPRERDTGQQNEPSRRISTSTTNGAMKPIVYGTPPSMDMVRVLGATGSTHPPGIASHRATNTSVNIAIEVPVHHRLTPLTPMKQSVQLIDSAFHWSDQAMEYLLDQGSYFVVGVIGLQGSGKSTVASLLAGCKPDDESTYIFKTQTPDIRELAGHQTSGADIYITAQRTIILDTQPVLSASVLDYLINHEKYIPSEMTSPENCVEMQSLQLATFLMTVCHVVLVVQDWFADIPLLQCIKKAEMLKPSTANPNSDGEDGVEYFPNVVFVQNKATREDFDLNSIKSMQEGFKPCLVAGVESDPYVTAGTEMLFQSYDNEQNIGKALMSANFFYPTGAISLTQSGLMAGANASNLPLDINLFLLPHLHDTSSKPKSPLFSILPNCYQGHPSRESLIRAFRKLVIGAQRTPIATSCNTEKNWFHYAARMWETIKKSTLMSEYNRLLV